MARTENVTTAMREYRRTRRGMNQRLLRAKAEGRLDQELRLIAREAREWWASMGNDSKPRRKVK